MHGLAEHIFKIDYRTYAFDLQGNSAATPAELTGYNRVPAAGTKRRLNTGNLFQALSAQPRTHPTTANTTRRKE